MTRTSLCSLLVLAVFWISSASAVADGFTVSELTIGAMVNDSSSGVSDVDGIHLWDPGIPNPYQQTFFASVAESTSETTGDFAWSSEAGLGSFLVEGAHVAAGVPSSVLFSSSSGFIWITPTEDLSLSIDSAFSYVLGADPMLARLSVSVFATDPFTSLFHQQLDADSFFDPPVGTLSIEGHIILPPGRTWAMSYDMELLTWGNTVGHFATGSGFVDFQITPEPASLCLFALGALGLPKRNRSRGR